MEGQVREQRSEKKIMKGSLEQGGERCKDAVKIEQLRERDARMK